MKCCECVGENFVKDVITYSKKEEDYDNPAFDPDVSDLTVKRSFKTWMTLCIIGLCIIGVAIWIFHNKYYLGQCENKMSTAKIGEPICISYTSPQRATSSPSSIQVQHMTSQYFNALEVFKINVSSNNFVQQNGDWKVYYNFSDQQFSLKYFYSREVKDECLSQLW
ncbi:unnamed protein product [Mytilus edulis]|uniref:Uncharacterized protein n=1 Tax=Mytilus edulis TaxID=6550 RepID=A0A8S3RDK0_MYTED|nr:unnamed protein product [Mytilus edulis]